MPVVETIGRIRREHRVKGRLIKEIARDLKVSRNTVRKVLRSGATSYEYTRAVQPRPKLGAWHGDLDRMLSDNEGKAARERLTLIRVFEELRGLGYEGSYDAVRRYAKKWRIERGAATAEAYVPLSFAPGGLPVRPVARGGRRSGIKLRNTPGAIRLRLETRDVPLDCRGDAAHDVEEHGRRQIFASRRYRDNEEDRTCCCFGARFIGSGFRPRRDCDPIGDAARCTLWP
jgi:transposase